MDDMSEGVRMDFTQCLALVNYRNVIETTALLLVHCEGERWL